MLSPLISLLGALAISLIIGPRAIRILASLKARQVISEDVPRHHLEKQGTPMMGGVIILLGAAAGLIAGTATSSTPDSTLWGVALLTLASGGLGFLDDYLIARRGKSLGLKARQKLLGQFALAIAFVVWICAVRSEYPTAVLVSGRFVDLGWVYYPLAVLLVVGMSNAVNLTDGLDGLVGGVTTLVMLTLGAIMAIEHQTGLAVFCFAVAGGCLGFLRYNINPAKVFMGDTGSLALGGAVAGVALAARMEILVIVVGVIFVVEALSVLLQVVSYKLTGVRIFKMSPVHHHFELLGWPETTVVKRFWAVQIIISTIVLLRVLVVNR